MVALIPDEDTWYAVDVVASSTGPWNFGFQYFAKTDLEVTVDNVALDQSDWNLTPGSAVEAGGYDGGSFSLVTAVANARVVIARKSVVQRDSNLSASQLSFQNINALLNKHTYSLQELRRDIARALLANYGTSGSTFDPDDIDAVVAIATEIETVAGIDTEILVTAGLATEIAAIYADMTGPGTIATVAGALDDGTIGDLIDGQVSASATIATLQLRESVSDGHTCYVSGHTAAGDGGGGPFIWDESDLSAKVTLDPQKHIYVPPSGEDGSNGAWVRDHRGFLFAEQIGMTADSRASASANSTALQTALDLCDSEDVSIYAAGIFFLEDPIVGTCPPRLYGAGNNYWSKQYGGGFSPQSATAFVFTGTGSKDQTLDGVSSCYAWGAGRPNPSARAGYNDSEYRLDTFVTSSTSAASRSLQSFSAAFFFYDKACNGGILDGFRVMPDAGGDDGMEGVRSSDRTVTKALSSGDWDVGLYIRSVRQMLIRNVQFVGQWRRGGLLMASHNITGAAHYACYDNYFDKCVFNIVHIRAADVAPIVATTTTTFDIPWADDHPFGADGENDLILTTGGRLGDAFTYTGMTKVTGGSYDILRFTGVSPDPTGYTNCQPGHTGGGTSRVRFNECSLQGFGHGSLEPSENDDLGGSGLGYFSYPRAILQISGEKITEISFTNCEVSGYETVAWHLHSARNVKLPVYLEMNNGARLIGSGARATNAYTIHSSVPAATESLEIEWEPFGSTIGGGTIDARPWVTELDDPDLFTDPSDPGYWDGVRLRSDRFSLVEALDLGGMVSAQSGGFAGLGRMTQQLDFRAPSISDFDLALYYYEPDDDVKLNRDITPVTDVASDIGSASKRVGTVWTSGMLSYEVELDDDTAASFTPPRAGGFLHVVAYNGESLPLNTTAGIIYFDAGSSAICEKQSGSGIGGSLSATTGALTGTDGTDTNLIISTHTDGKIYVENRLGNTRTIRISICG